MSGGDIFLDTNIIVYVLSADTAKAERATEILEAGGVISVQVLNEFVVVARSKKSMFGRQVRICNPFTA